MPTIVAEVTRGGVVESVHHGAVAVVDTGGHLIAKAGDADYPVYFRSSGKPFQALPVIESGAANAHGFTSAELALCCASHAGEGFHQAAVRGMLTKIGLSPADLRCGSPLPYNDVAAAEVLSGQVPRSPVQCDCSGKHAGMLAVCRHLGYPLATYLQPDHPLQRTIQEIMGEMLRLPAADLTLATDGCGVPTFRAPMRSFAAAYAALAAPERTPTAHGGAHSVALNRLRAAMIDHPENVAGTDQFVTDVMTIAEGALVVKSGAEGLLTVGVPAAGLGIAIRILDGSFRAHAVVLAATLRQLDLLPESMIAAVLAQHDPVIRNHVGAPVGELRSVVQLAR